MFSLVQLIEGLISSVPEAIGLWNKIAPLVEPKAEVDEAVVSEINQLAPLAHAAVASSAAAIGSLISVHSAPAAASPSA